MSDVRVVLKDDWPLSKIETFAFELDWGYVQTVLETDTLPFQKIWDTHVETHVAYTEDPWIGVRYFCVRGREVAAVAATILEVFPTFTREELISDAAKADGRGLKSLAVRRLLVGTGHAPGEDVVKAADRLLRDPDPVVRRDVVTAVGYAPWSALRSIVQELADRDPDTEVRECSRLMLDEWPGAPSVRH